MEILILGFVLIILGVGATFAYDKVKAEREAIKVRRASMPAPVTKPKATVSKKSRSLVDADEEFLRAFEDSMKPKRTIKRASIRAKQYRDGDMPDETLNELFDDLSTTSTLTVQELIEKIERLKKRK